VWCFIIDAGPACVAPMETVPHIMSYVTRSSLRFVNQLTWHVCVAPFIGATHPLMCGARPDPARARPSSSAQFLPSPPTMHPTQISLKPWWISINMSTEFIPNPFLKVISSDPFFSSNELMKFVVSRCETLSVKP
jgi:hypothetical protein